MTLGLYARGANEQEKTTFEVPFEASFLSRHVVFGRGGGESGQCRGEIKRKLPGHRRVCPVQWNESVKVCRPLRPPPPNMLFFTFQRAFESNEHT